MPASKLKFYVQSPETNEAKGKRFPLLSCVVGEIDAPTITKTGAIGRTIVCLIRYKSLEWEGNAVCHPLDEFNFREGARMALRRALQSSGLNKVTRTRFYRGLRFVLDHFL